MTTVTGVVHGTEEDVQIGIFDQGVVVDDDKIVDCATRETLLVRWINGCWVSYAESEQARKMNTTHSHAVYVPSKFFGKIHVQ